MEQSKEQLAVTEDLRSKWLTLSDDEKDILGRPNFACGRIAERMRQMDFECNRKAEDEQALVIFTMLQFYKEHGKDWADKMNQYLNQLLTIKPQSMNKQEQLAYLKRLKEMSNSDLLLEYTQMAGGDDYDGCYTESGQWEWEQLQKELNDRLVKVGFINNQNSNL